jgi:integrase
MQDLISAKLVKQLRPNLKPFEVRDTRVKGFLLRVQPSGAMTYYAQYGRGKRVSLGRSDVISVERARERARDILAGAQFGEDPLKERRLAKAHTLRSFINEVYEPWAGANLRSGAGTVARLRASFADHLDSRLGDLTPWIVEKWRATRIKSGISAGTVNRDLGALRAAVGRAVGWDLLDANPIADVKRSKIDVSRAPRYLLPDEEGRLRRALDAREERLRGQRDTANAWRAARGYELLPNLRATTFADHLKPLVLISLNTGMRRGELFALTWESVDLVSGRITVHGITAKSGKTRHIPLNAEVLTTVRGWRDQSLTASGLVFPARSGEALTHVRRAWESTLRAAGITRFRWHDLRHSFASKLVMAGVDLNTVRELLGHSDYAMTQRYAHLAPEHKAAAVARLVTTAQ